MKDRDSEEPELTERQLLTRLVEEAEESCSHRASHRPAAPAWLWPVLSMLMTIGGVVYVTGQFNGKFEEFRMAVYQRLDRLERLNDSERHRSPAGYVSPPVGQE
jgi:hypothetical protein